VRNHLRRPLRAVKGWRASAEHGQAVACFALLYELLEALDSGKASIAEEAGSWMIPADRKAWLKAYRTSLAATSTPEAFTAAALPLVKRDRRHSFSAEAYPSALEVANPKQKVHLQAKVQRQGVPTGPAF
jgi:hypothetical protein